MFNRFLPLLLCFSTAAVSAQSPASIDSLLETALKNYHIPGASLVIVYNDSVIFSKGYGYSNLERQLPMDPQTSIVRCGSVSKSFTATAVLQLVDKGILNLHSPIDTYLSQEERETFGLTKSVTLHQLLTHTAGFDERLFGSHAWEYEQWMPLAEYFKKHPLKFRSEPGKILNYNDQGIALAGYIVEKVSGKPFYDVIDENIFQPLQMNQSSFNPKLPVELQKNLSQSYFYNNNKFEAYPYDYVLPYPAAGLVSTTGDIAKFMMMHLSRGEPILSISSAEKMHNRQFGNNPRLRGWCYGFAEWYENNHRFIFKDGQATGFNSRLLMFPEQKWGFYLVWNRSVFNRGAGINEANRLKSELTSFLLDQFFPDTFARKEMIPIPYTQSSDSFEGNYREMNMSLNDWSRMISLALQDKVAKTDNGAWSIFGGRYIQIADLTFQWHEGGEFYAGFTRDGDSVKYLHFGTGSYERVPWYEEAGLNLTILVFFHLSFLITLTFAIIQFVKMRQQLFLVIWISSLISVVAFPLINLSFFTTDFQDLYKGPTLLMIVSSWMPFFGLILLIPFLKKIFNYKKWLGILCLVTVLWPVYLWFWNFPFTM